MELLNFPARKSARLRGRPDYAEWRFDRAHLPRNPPNSRRPVQIRPRVGNFGQVFAAESRTLPRLRGRGRCADRQEISDANSSDNLFSDLGSKRRGSRANGPGL